MDIIDAQWVVNQAFPILFHRENAIYSPKESAFHDLVINCLDDPKFRNVTVNSDGETADIVWLAFLWQIYNGDATRINDFLHGYYWSAGTEYGAPCTDSANFMNLLAADPIVQAERIKAKDFIKHDNWVYHKTQDLPKITVFGRSNFPERLHSPRQVKITVLDSKTKLPVKFLFADRGQRKRYRAIESYNIFDVCRTTDYKMEGTQNVVIIADADITLNEEELVAKIVDASCYLTEHGRCLFDVPLYHNHQFLAQSSLYRLIKPFIPEREQSFVRLGNASDIDEYIHRIVNKVNQAQYLKDNHFSFQIEEIKLTDVGLDRSIAARIYLKKNIVR